MGEKNDKGSNQYYLKQKSITKIDETQSQFFSLKINKIDKCLENLRKINRIHKSAISGIKQ